jgi:hypothetical protein
MKKLIPLILILCACHTRKALTAKTDSVSTFSVSKDSVHTETKVKTDSIHGFSLTTDSTNITGVGTVTISSNGTMITGTYHYTHTNKATHDTSANAFTEITDHSEIKADSASQTAVHKTVKQVSHPFNWWWLTTLIPVIVGLYFKFKSKS